jgi:hypothetical protein
MLQEMCKNQPAENRSQNITEKTKQRSLRNMSSTNLPECYMTV